MLVTAGKIRTNSLAIFSCRLRHANVDQPAKIYINHLYVGNGDHERELRESVLLARLDDDKKLNKATLFA